MTDELTEAVAAAIAHSDGLDFNEVCGVDANPDEGECDSGTCIAAHFEEHDAEYARSIYRHQATAAIAAVRAHDAAQAESLADAINDLVGAAYHAGATDVHNAWIAGNGQSEADFGESASDYIAHVEPYKALATALAANGYRLVKGEPVAWQPIKTAPHDGSAILLGYFHKNLDGTIYEQGGAPIMGRWLRGAWWNGTQQLNHEGHFSPTHWMPRPAPPEEIDND